MRGGRREGAGRKKGSTKETKETTMVQFAIRVPKETKERLKEIPTDEMRRILKELAEKAPI